uniref:Uncharacterized protein n=1 Tax=Anguilla anguilla TaxID=7936 RepID=A0A0E9UU00_ANGAN
MRLYVQRGWVARVSGNAATWSDEHFQNLLSSSSPVHQMLPAKL